MVIFNLNYINKGLLLQCLKWC